MLHDLAEGGHGCRDGKPNPRLGRFMVEVSPSLKKIARSLRQHRELILDYFRAQKLISSGVVEGLNTKAKVTMRKSYGFRTCRVLELASIIHLASCPNPNLPTNSSDESKFAARVKARRSPVCLM